MGIPIVYFRSSSFNGWAFCQQQYLFEYTLGIKGPSGKKADKGTITHKILEICAVCKKAAQEGKKTIVDEEIGEVVTDNYDPEYLASIGSRVFQYYKKEFNHHKWTDRDFSDCISWAWKTLKYKDGMFDPRNRNVVDAEPHFNFEIKEDWAKYDYPEYNLSGHLSLKGTIDLITDVGNGVYEMIDYKTGRRLDWATGKEKTQEKLFSDPQLRLYHYACKRLYPEVKSFLITMIFINDGGAYTIHLNDSDIPKTEQMIRSRFEKIKNTEMPKLIKEVDKSQCWKCTTLCHAGKTTFEDTHVVPITEHRPWKKNFGKPMTKCDQVRHVIKQKGIDYVIKNYKDPDHVHGAYGHGGGKLREEGENNEK